MGTPDDVFAMSTVHRDHAVVVQVSGEVDVATAPRLEHEVRRCLFARPAVVVVDMTRVTFCSSAGIRVLGFAQARSAETTLAVVADGARVPRVLQLSGMTEVMQVYPSMEAALAATAPKPAAPHGD